MRVILVTGARSNLLHNLYGGILLPEKSFIQVHYMLRMAYNVKDHFYFHFLLKSLIQDTILYPQVIRFFNDIDKRLKLNELP